MVWYGMVLWAMGIISFKGPTILWAMGIISFKGYSKGRALLFYGLWAGYSMGGLF
jgi:hypothetical protein